MADDVTIELIEAMEGVAVNHYITVVAVSILLWDYMLTIDSEIERFWFSGRLNWAKALFYVNRYLNILGHAPIVMEHFWASNTPDKVKSYHQYLAIAIQIIVASMLIMRMYALYEKSRKVLVLYLGISATAVAVGCWSVLGGRTSEKPHDVWVPVGCGVSLTKDQAIRLGAAWTGMLVFDFLVFGMTLYKSFTLPRRKGLNLLSVLLRDGAIYFVVIIAANLSNILSFIFGGPYTRGVVTTFTNIISSVMISRLMLNLRDPSLAPQSAHTTRVSATDGTTYPNLTFLDTRDITHYTDGDTFDARATSLNRDHGGYKHKELGKLDEKRQMEPVLIEEIELRSVEQSYNPV